MPLWVFDLDTDRDCRRMSDADFGRYMRLLIRQWIEGSVPANPSECVRDAMLDDGCEGRVQSLLDRKFSEQDGEVRRNARLEQERKVVMERVSGCRTRGKKGGRPVQQNIKSALEPDGSAHAYGSGSVSGSSKKKSKDYPPEFLRFWQEYPRKIGKGDALKAWRQADLPDTDTLIAAVRAQKQTRQWKEERIIPNPGTWLRRRSWEDEVQTTTESRTLPADSEQAVRKSLEAAGGDIEKAYKLHCQCYGWLSEGKWNELVEKAGDQC